MVRLLRTVPRAERKGRPRKAGTTESIGIPLRQINLAIASMADLGTPEQARSRANFQERSMSVSPALPGYPYIAETWVINRRNLRDSNHHMKEFLANLRMALTWFFRSFGCYLVGFRDTASLRLLCVNHLHLVHSTLAVASSSLARMCVVNSGYRTRYPHVAMTTNLPSASATFRELLVDPGGHGWVPCQAWGQCWNFRPDGVFHRSENVSPARKHTS